MNQNATGTDPKLQMVHTVTFCGVAIFLLLLYMIIVSYLVCIFPISGLEALQLLVGLNLSHNQITSFTALEPIKYSKSLKVLDLSFNEIGSHPVDTTRYLCASPLSQTYDATEIINELARENIQIGDFWEAVLLFKSLQLVQLDMQGNPVANERFRVLVEKVNPCLRWLDGKSLN